MSTTTTTVETLSAEVRTLVVGKRQITLSVFRQLDCVPLEQCQAFGRVRDKGSDALLVGRDRDSGALVRSWYFEPWEPVMRGPFVIGPNDLGGETVTVCGSISAEGLYFEEELVGFLPDAVTKCGVAGHGFGVTGGRCSHWHTNGLDDRIRAAIDRRQQIRAMHLAAAELPLIVLAGLR